jgi:hypothetical protein
MARYCPQCGAENPDYSYYCSKCATSLRFESERVVRARPIRRVPPPRDEPTEIRKALKNMNRVILIFSGVAVLVHLPSLFRNGEDVTWIRVSLLAFLALFVAATYETKIITNDKHIQFFRHRDFSRDALAEVKGFNINLVWYAVAIVLVLSVAQVWLYKDPFAVVVSVVISVALVSLIFISMMVPSAVVVEANGICIGNPRAIVRSYISFGFIGSVKVTTRRMTFKITGKTPWGTVPKKLFIRADPSSVALAIRRTSPATQVSIDPRVSDFARMNRRLRFEQ